jgi:hypothetical protein
MSARLIGASVTHNRDLETCEPSCVPEAARPFFIPTVHNPLGAVGYVTTSELSSRGGRGRSHGTRGSAGAHLDREARSGAEEHVAAPELNSARRRDLGPCGNTGAHLDRKVRSGLQDTWRHRSSPRYGGEVQSYMICSSVWMHVILLVLT